MCIERRPGSGAHRPRRIGDEAQPGRPPAGRPPARVANGARGRRADDGCRRRPSPGPARRGRGRRTPTTGRTAHACAPACDHRAPLRLGDLHAEPEEAQAGDDLDRVGAEIESCEGDRPERVRQDVPGDDAESAAARAAGGGDEVVRAAGATTARVSFRKTGAVTKTAMMPPIRAVLELPSAAKIISANRNSGTDWIISASRENRARRSTPPEVGGWHPERARPARPRARRRQIATEKSVRGRRRARARRRRSRSRRCRTRWRPRRRQGAAREVGLDRVVAREQRGEKARRERARRSDQAE